MENHTSRDQTAGIQFWEGRRNAFKHAVSEGTSCPIALWVSVPWIESVEVMAHRGVDAAFIDLEHGPFGLEDVANLVRAAEVSGTSPFVRIDRGDVQLTSRLLDLGVQGIIFPRVESADDARLCYRATEYAPAGLRGWGGSHTRFAMWSGPFASELANLPVSERGVYSERYKSHANDFIFRLFLIESESGVQNVGEILDTGCADGVSFGWGDFSASVEFDLARCEEALDEVYSCAKSAGVGMELHPAHVESGRTPWYPGCFLLAGHDSLIYSRGIEAAVSRSRKTIATIPHH